MATGLVVVPVAVFVGAAVDLEVTVVLEGSALVLPDDVGGVEEGVCCSVDVGTSTDVVVGGVSDVLVGGSLLDVVVGEGAAEVVGSCVVDSVVGGAGSDEVVTGGVDVSAVEVGCSVADVGVGVPESLEPILVLLEDMVKRRSKVSRRRGGLYMVTLAPASDGEVWQNGKASLTFS